MWLKRILRLVGVLAIIVTSTSSAQYIGSSNSDKFHETSCRHAKKITDENKVEFETAEAAGKAGYLPCKTCKPAKAKVESSNSDVMKNPGESGQCRAVTKKGTQCKRKAQAGKEYCWQHP